MVTDQRRRQVKERERIQDYTPLKDLKLTDHFLFGEVMCDPETCKTALEIILGRRVSRIKYYNREQGMEVHPSYKGIRLDVCFEDEEDVIYSVEIQNANRYHIPRRSRHYQSVIDVKIMPRGEVDYSRLPDGIIIFICTFDLFGLGRYCYTFENRCLEQPELSLGDGTKKIFLNTRGKNDRETDEELIEFLHCVEHTNDVQTGNQKIQRILRRVHEVKRDAEVEGRYMTTLTWMNELKADAIAEGLAEGRARGREEGRTEGLAEGRAEGIVQGREAGKGEEAQRYSAMTIKLLDQKRYNDLEKAAKDSVFREELYRELGIG